METLKKLTEREQKRLAICQQTIIDGLQTCFDTGAALLEIRDFKLFREHFDTFQEYCQSNFQIGENYANRLITSSEVKESIEGSSVAGKITNEAQARELAKVPEEKRVNVIKQALKSDPNLTAESIRSVTEIVPIGTSLRPIGHCKNEKMLPEKPVIELDPVDNEKIKLPPKTLELWNRRPEIQELLSAISKIKGVLKRAQEDNDPMFREVSFSAALADLTNAYSNISTAMPHTVCTVCQGLRPEKCTLCKGKGLLSLFAWKTFVPQELKDVREKANR